MNRKKRNERKMKARAIRKLSLLIKISVIDDFTGSFQDACLLLGKMLRSPIMEPGVIEFLETSRRQMLMEDAKSAVEKAAAKQN